MSDKCDKCHDTQMVRGPLARDEWWPCPDCTGTSARAGVSCAALVDALKAALTYWHQNAEIAHPERKPMALRTDYESEVYRRCKSELTKASTLR